MENYRFQIVLKNSLSEDDKNVIIQLYQPILGLTSAQIYLALVEEFKLMQKMPKSVFSMPQLADFLGLDINSLREGLKKIEGMGLIKTFVSDKTKTLTYFIQKPLAPSVFFNNVLFNDVLKQKIGAERYEMVKVFYLSERAFVSSDEFVETTSNFEQAFSSEFQSFRLHDVNVSTNTINNELIDFSSIQDQMNLSNMDSAALNNEVKEIILANLAQVSFGDQELLNVIKESYDVNNYLIDQDKLRVLLKGIVVAKQESEVDELTETKVREMEEHDAIEYASLLEEHPVDRTITNIINNLRKRIFGFKKPNDGVINCLLEFSYWKNNAKIVGNYLYKIADSIVEKGLDTTRKVMDYLKGVASYTKGKVHNVKTKVNNAFSRIKEPISDYAEKKAIELKHRAEEQPKSLEWLKQELNGSN